MSMQAEGATGDWDRRGGWFGLAAVALVIAWLIVILGAGVTGFDASDEEIRNFFAPDGGSSGWVILAALFLGLAAVALLAFVAVLASILRRAEGGAGVLARIAFAGGVLLAGLLVLLNSIALGISLAVAFEDIAVEPAAYRLVDSVFFGLLMHVGITAAVLIGATSFVALGTSIFPRWLSWSGAGVAVLAFFSAVLFGLPLLLVLAWILAASIVLVRAEPAAPREVPAPG